jgi:dihydroorotase
VCQRIAKLEKEQYETLLLAASTKGGAEVEPGSDEKPVIKKRVRARPSSAAAFSAPHWLSVSVMHSPVATHCSAFAWREKAW